MFLGAASCVFGCAYLCHQMGYFDRGHATHNITSERHVNDAVRVKHSLQYATKKESREREKRCVDSAGHEVFRC